MSFWRASKAAARIPGWHPDHAMTGEIAEELLKELLLGGNKNRRRTAKGICRIILLHVCGYDCAWE